MAAKKLTMREIAEKALRKAGHPMTREEIWELAFSTFPEEFSTKGKTPADSIGVAIYDDMKREGSVFTFAGERPRRFGLTEWAESDHLPLELPAGQKEEEPSEEALYTPVMRFLENGLLIDQDTKAKRIRHTRSRNQREGQNKWLHPDIVALSIPRWGQTALDLGVLLDAFVSFTSVEVKLSLTSANIHECFFQALSNSSWANMGLLIAKEIDDKPEFLKRLRRLSRMYGIGVVRLDFHNPEESEILFHPALKKEVDIDFVDHLSLINDDFKDVASAARDALQTKKMNPIYFAL